MSQPDPLETVRRAARQAVLARRRRDEAIRAAHKAGCSLRQIGAAAGITHPRVLAIVREAERKS